EILIYNPATGLYTTYFYKTLGLGGTGRRSTASSSFNQANAQLDLTQGILIKRKQGSNLEIKIFGTVKTGPTMAEVQPGLNILGNVYPIDTLTLGNSCLYTGVQALALMGLEAKPALPQLAEVLKRADRLVAPAAAQLLGHLGPEAVPVLEDALGRGDVMLRAAVVAAL